MPREEYQWEVKLVRERYRRFKVTLEQARRIHKYENEKLAFPSKHLLSPWEELDYDRTFFKDILSDKQFEIYQKEYERLVEETKQGLIKSDKEAEKEVQYSQELLGYYQTKLLPAFSDKILFVLKASIREEKAKLDFLRSEYKQFLNDSKSEMIQIHFRYNRTYQPTYLKAALLRYELLSVWPNYNAFKRKMDAPTLVVADFLEKRVSLISPTAGDFIKRITKGLGAIQRKLFKKYYGGEGGWHVVIGKQSEEEERTGILMNVLLLD